MKAIAMILLIVSVTAFSVSAQWTKTLTKVSLTSTADSLGIGTSSPVSKLDVNGTVRSAGLLIPGATSTIYSKFNLDTILLTSSGSSQSTMSRLTKAGLGFSKVITGTTGSKSSASYDLSGMSISFSNVYASLSTALASGTATFTRGGQGIPYNMTTIQGGQISLTDKNDTSLKTMLTPTSLSVMGTIRAKEVIVTMSPFPDYVFKSEYRRPSLDDVEGFIGANGHLPNMPSEKEVSEKGIGLSELNSKIVEKVEELTLYLIDLKKENDVLKEKVAALETASK